MKKIKITEKQAEFLGLNKIKEIEQPAGYVSLGAKAIRIVIEGPTVPKFKDFILKAIAKQDETAKVDYFEATKKIVGTVSENKIPAITRDIKAIDPTIVFARKSITKALNPTQVKEGIKGIKLTRGQYNRLISSGLIKESDNVVVGGMNRVDKAFQNGLGGKLKEEGGEGDIKKETLELIKYLYRKSEDLSPFWKEKGLSYDDICQNLLAKKLIIDKEGKYELSKTAGSPDKAIANLENELNTMIGGSASEEGPATDTAPDAEVVKTEPTKPATAPEIETEDAGTVPAGTETNPDSPWNQNAQTTKPKQSPVVFKVVAMNREIAIVRGPENALYVFWIYDLNKEHLFNYAKVDKTPMGQDGDGQPEYDFGDFEITPDVIEAYLNDNFKTIRKGNGLADYEGGALLVRIDEPLKKELALLYDKNKDIVTALTGVQEMTGAGSSGAFTAPMGMVTKNMPTDANQLNTPIVKETKALGHGYTHFALFKADNKIATGWDYSSLYDKASKSFDTTSISEYSRGDLKNDFPNNKPSEFKVVTKAFLAKNGIDPANTNNWFKQGISEMTSAGSAGHFQYDANALPGIGRDGSFKKTSPTKAEQKTQWVGGSFVKMNDCTKYNNKPAGAGCSQGAVDNVVSTQKTKGNVNAPSLSECQIVKGKE